MSKMKTIAIRIPKEVYDKIDKISDSQNLSISSYIRFMVLDYMKFDKKIKVVKRRKNDD